MIYQTHSAAEFEGATDDTFRVPLTALHGQMHGFVVGQNFAIVSDCDTDCATRILKQVVLESDAGLSTPINPIGPTNECCETWAKQTEIIEFSGK